VTVTDPRHALYGFRLQVASVVGARGPRFIVLVLPDGRRRHVLRAATDLERPPAAADPVRSRISARSLLPLARLIRSMLAAPDVEAGHADQAGSSPSADIGEAHDADLAAPCADLDGSTMREPGDRADASSPAV
jgi:hypothetical protein